MRNQTKLLFGALTAAFVLAAGVGTAAARSLSFGEQSFRTIWTPLDLNSEEGGGGVDIRCNVTLEGSFHYRTIAKVVGALIGVVTRAIVARPCEGSAEAFTLTAGEGQAETLPWPVTYESFSGTLPRITRLRVLLRPSFLIQVTEGPSCLYSGNATGEIEVNAGGNATSIIPDRTVAVPLAGGPAELCPPNGYFSATARQNSIRGLASETLNIRLI